MIYKKIIRHLSKFDNAKSIWKTIIKKILFVITGLTFFSLSQSAFASTGESPVGQGIGYLINNMYGADGVAIATVAIIAVGLLCLGHVLEWKRLIQTVIGVAIIFGAGAIVSGIRAMVTNSF